MFGALLQYERRADSSAVCRADSTNHKHTCREPDPVGALISLGRREDDFLIPSERGRGFVLGVPWEHSQWECSSTLHRILCLQAFEHSSLFCPACLQQVKL